MSLYLSVDISVGVFVSEFRNTLQENLKIEVGKEKKEVNLNPREIYGATLLFMERPLQACPRLP